MQSWRWRNSQSCRKEEGAAMLALISALDLPNAGLYGKVSLGQP